MDLPECAFTTASPRVQRDLVAAFQQLPTGLPVRFRFRSRRDEDALAELLARVYPEPVFGKGPLGCVEDLRRQLAWFPEGQWVAERPDGGLVGAAMCLQLDLGEALAPHTRRQLLENCRGEAGPPWGNALYGVGLVVDPDFRQRGIGRFMIQLQRAMGRLMGCHTLLWGARLPGYHRHRHLGPREYLARVARGQLWDPALGPMMAMGFQILGLLERYTEDPESMGHGALLHRVR